MKLNRDFDLEATTGECSYCGYQLPVVEAPDGDLLLDSCPFCDAYEAEQDAEAFEQDLFDYNEA